VGERLQQSLISEEAKHPLILPGNHKTVELLARQMHERNGHVLSLLRDRYWIIGGSRLIRRIVHQCIRCKKILARLQQQLMGRLPAVRVTASTAPFDNVGVDVFGPFELKIGRSVHKRYGYIFVCKSSRAIHISMWMARIPCCSAYHGHQLVPAGFVSFHQPPRACTHYNVRQ
jgi:hypothetical protein